MSSQASYKLFCQSMTLSQFLPALIVWVWTQQNKGLLIMFKYITLQMSNISFDLSSQSFCDFCLVNVASQSMTDISSQLSETSIIITPHRFMDEMDPQSDPSSILKGKLYQEDEADELIAEKWCDIEERVGGESYFRLGVNSSIDCFHKDSWLVWKHRQKYELRFRHETWSNIPILFPPRSSSTWPKWGVQAEWIMCQT